MSDSRITPPDVTSMTVEARGDLEAMITVERGNADSVQVMTLTTQEWRSLQAMLETFAGNWSPAVHLSFKAFEISRETPRRG